MWWFQTNWSSKARTPVAVGVPVVVVWFSYHWFRYSGARLLALIRGQGDTGGGRRAAGEGE
ncbi:hypothetical protein [Streptacidiphilus sp. PAMC 29251]